MEAGLFNGLSVRFERHAVASLYSQALGRDLSSQQSFSTRAVG